ncbi:dynein heavy chain, partial [Coemansia sp. RSA 2523]
CIYGGRIDSDFDHRVLRVFIDRWFCADAYNADFALVNDDCVVRGPDGTSHEEFVAWCHELPEHEPPVWLGLPPNAETLVLVQKGQEFVADVRRLRSLMDDDDDDDVEAGAQTSGVPAYMRHIDTVATAFSQQLPQALPLLSLPSPSSSLVQTPLFRVIERETRVAHKLLTLVHRDLHALRRVCRGETKQTNHVRNLLRDFNANVVPRAWLQYTVPRGCSLSRWVTDFAMRVDHIRELSSCIESATAQTMERVQSVRVWLGGLLFPEAFVTATRQSVAKQLECSLEELHVGLSPFSENGVAFMVSGLRVEGAEWTRGLVVNEGSASHVQVGYLSWSKTQSEDGVVVPVYLNGDRSLLLFEVRVPVEHSVDAHKVVQRAVAIVAA